MEQPTALLSIDDKYVDATVAYIRSHARGGSRAGTGFFIYFASHHTHTPAFAKARAAAPKTTRALLNAVYMGRAIGAVRALKSSLSLAAGGEGA